MKTKTLFTLALAGLIAVSLIAISSAKSTKYKMTTQIPPGISIQDKLETPIGTLNFFDGVPDKETARKVYDNLDLNRAVQAYLSTIQIASMSGMRKGILEMGPANTSVLTWETMMDSKALFLTPNTTSIYSLMWLEIGDEPMVIETPPNVLGAIDDFWFHYVVDFGKAGPDKGKGGKFLILPPGYKGTVPDGYHVAQSGTHGNWVFWRGFPVDGDPKPAVAMTQKTFRVYPLSQKDNPPNMQFINASGKFFNTIHSMDYGYWEEVNEVVQAEPPEGQDPEILGQLAAIGIKKGTPFQPDARMKKILEQAADIGNATARTLTARPSDDVSFFFPGKRAWRTTFIGGSYQFLDHGVSLLDARTFFHFYATGITPAMTIKMVNKGSQYAVAYMDANDDALDGGKTYKVHLPPNVPAKDFWSFVVYDNQTRSMLQTDQQFPSVSSARKSTQKNADGSFDIYFGPTSPKGKEGNWIQTIPGKGWNMLFRLYGPMQAWFDKTWMPGDPELVK